MTREMAVLDQKGDLKVIWDAERPDEVEAARKQFDEFTKKKRYLAFSVKKDGSKSEIIKEFDPDAEKLILSPMVVGG